jgi:hypothetical protein
MRLSLKLMIVPACLALTPLAAEETPGGSLMEEGAKLFLRGLMAQAEPVLDEMERSLREMEPALREMGPRLKQLVDLMGDVTNYEAPERLPNGDILIRRKPGAPPAPVLPAPDANRLDQGGEIEL